MRQVNISDVVTLRVDMPDQRLPKGSVGVVCSLWFAPNVAYEVEFRPANAETASRVLLNARQFESEDEGLLGTSN